MSAEQPEPKRSLAERVILWAQGLPLWQADAVRRLLLQAGLTDTDKREILLLLKADHGLLPDGVRAPLGRRPQLGELSGTSETRGSLVLCSIQKLKNINAIPDESSLPIGNEGLTVVYGENGSGKSGYARVLKLACRARGSDKSAILPDVFAGSASPPGPASAEFVVCIEAERKTLQWEFGKKQPRELARVAFFDADCARYTLDKENKPLYSPYGAFVFGALAALMREMREKLEAEKPALTPPDVTGLEPGTAALQFVSNLTASTTAEAITKACVWSEADEVALHVLEQDISRLEAEDPQVLAAQSAALKMRMDALVDALRKADAVVSGAALADFAAKQGRVAAADKALQVLREGTAQEPLKGVGSDEWRILYDAAREYSTKHAYPSEVFPNVAPGSKCVFCQQEILEDGSARLRRFKAFMESTVTSEYTEAKAALQSAEKSRREFAPPQRRAFEDVLLALTNRAPDIADAATAYLEAVQPRQGDVPAGSSSAASLPECPLTALEQFSAKLGDSADDYRKKPKSDILAQSRQKLAGLSSRKSLAVRKTSIKDHVAALERRAKLDKCQRVLNTRAVTEMQDKLNGEILTQELQDKLSAELTGLGAPGFLVPKGIPREGDTLLALELREGGRKIEASPTAVLSEGEQRVAAIAGFLAELAASEHAGPIAFDDPVCSLDHRFRDRIADRLVKEALSRQVIVFTHDISFLLALRSCASEQRCLIAPLAVERARGKPGFTTKAPPWEAQEWGQQIEWLRSELRAIEGLSGSEPSEYNRRAAALYDKLRGTWETVIEDVILNGVIHRHEKECKPTRLESVYLTDENYRELMLQYTRCSLLGDAHAKARTLDGNRPAPAEVAEDILKVERYVQALTAERKPVKAARKKCLDPQPSNIG